MQSVLQQRLDKTPTSAWSQEWVCNHVSSPQRRSLSSVEDHSKSVSVIQSYCDVHQEASHLTVSEELENHHVITPVLLTSPPPMK